MLAFCFAAASFVAAFFFPLPFFPSVYVSGFGSFLSVFYFSAFVCSGADTPETAVAPKDDAIIESQPVKVTGFCDVYFGFTAGYGVDYIFDNS